MMLQLRSIENIKRSKNPIPHVFFWGTSDPCINKRNCYFFSKPYNQRTIHVDLAQRKVFFSEPYNDIIKELKKKFLLFENKQAAVQFNEISKQLKTHNTI